MEEGRQYTKKELKEIEKLRKQLQRAGQLDDNGEYYLGDDVCISVEEVFDLGIW
jgi:hypothetical protein